MVEELLVLARLLVISGALGPRPLSRPPLATRSLSSDSKAMPANRKRARADIVADGGRDSKRGNDRATHFVALRLESPPVWNKIAELQQALICASPELRACATPARKFHVTLLVLSLPPPNDQAAGPAIEAARAALHRAAHAAASRLESAGAALPLRVRVDGLDAFRSDVLFARVVAAAAAAEPDDAPIRALASAVAEAFAEAGLRSKDTKAFAPHATLMKTSKWRGRARDRPRITPNLWREHAHLFDAESAWISCPTIELLDMTAPEDGAGWYARIARAEVCSSDEASSDAGRAEDDLRISWAPLPRRPARDKAR